MAVDSDEECHSFHTVVILPEGTTDLQGHLNISCMEVPNMLKSEMWLNCKPNLLKGMEFAVDKVKNYVPCITDLDIEKGQADVPKSIEECLSNLNSEDSKVKALLRDFRLQIGGKLMQLLMNPGIEFPKFISRDRVHETPCSRSRKYKRTSSFNSRRVVLLSSVLSIMGTIILIYLTLRVRHISDGGYGNV